MSDKTSVYHVRGAHLMIELFNNVVARPWITNSNGIENINPSDTSRVIDNYAQPTSGQGASGAGDIYRSGQFFTSFMAEFYAQVESLYFYAVEAN